ncbi:MAG: hypothetical protein ACFCU9_11890 [Cyanophyceae cyanobacterium]
MNEPPSNFNGDFNSGLTSPMKSEQADSLRLWESFYENTLVWLGRPQEAYRLLSEAMLPTMSTWVRGNMDTYGFNHWDLSEIRTFLFPVLTVNRADGDTEAVVVPSEAMLLCGSGTYYNPCDLAIMLFVQRPEEPMSQLLQRIRHTEATVMRGPDMRMRSEQVNLTPKGQDYINTKYVVWPFDLRDPAQDTLIKQGFSLIKLSPQDASRPFATSGSR